MEADCKDSPQPQVSETEARPQQTQAARRFKMELSFDGTEYHGWQRQANGISVQEVLEGRLSRLFGDCRISVQGSSRTDSGVHALGMAASFDAPPSPYIPDDRICKALNRLLPPSIRVRSLELAPPRFNARHSAQAKSYVYVFNNRGDLNPFTERWTWRLTDFTDLDAVSEALGHVKGTHDFSSFTVERAMVDDPVRTIMRAELKVFGPLVCIHILGDGFLYKMVRSIVGVLAEVGRGKMPGSAMASILEARDRCAARDTAPAKGLFLMKVFYEPESWGSYEIVQPPFFML